MPSDFYMTRYRMLRQMNLTTEQRLEAYAESLFTGLDQVMDEIQAVRHLITRIERDRRGLPS